MKDKIIYSGNSNHEKAYVCGDATNEIIPNGLISKVEVKIDEKEQIEEMANIIDDCTWVTDENYCDGISCEECHAKRLYEQGCRIINKDSVVLSGKQCAEIVQDNYNIGYKRGSKETAEKLLNELYYTAQLYYGNNANVLAWAKDKAKQLGIEIRE